MAEQPQVTNVQSYTEASHTAYGDVTGAEPIEAGHRRFTPERVTVVYNWRTQLGDRGWRTGNVEISGPWLRTARAPAVGTGQVILWLRTAPQWAQDFARSNTPTTVLEDEAR